MQMAQIGGRLLGVRMPLPKSQRQPKNTKKKTMSQKRLTHHFLLPTARMQDERFFDALIYICRHHNDGAWGFIVNRPSNMSVGGLLMEAKVDAGAKAMQTPTLDAGPVRQEAGFVLHTGLPIYQSSFALSENVCLTTSRDILTDLTNSAKISHYLLCMGFCSWRRGQLEKEIGDGDWLTCPAKIEVLFHPDHQQKLDLALSSLGLNPVQFVSNVGWA